MAKIEVTDEEKRQLQLLERITQLSKERADIQGKINKCEMDLRNLREQLSGKDHAMEEAGAQLSKSLSVTVSIK